MKTEGSPLDMMSNVLPPNIIQKILTLLPMRDAFRTSILSRNWRYLCLSIPKLEFDDRVFRISSFKELSGNCQVLHVIFTVLLLHNGPLLEFSLRTSYLVTCCELDQIIIHVAKKTNLEKFTLCLVSGEAHKLPSSFFSMQRLTQLRLHNCAFQPPSTFNGFSRLTILFFNNVIINTKVLRDFICNCPLLKFFSLLENGEHVLQGEHSDFAELFECLPLVKYVHMDPYPLKCFGVGVTPHKLSTSLVHLKVLHFSGISFGREDDLHSILLLIAKAPNLRNIKIEIYNPMAVVAVPQISMNLLEQQDYSHVNLDHLRELEITNMEFAMLGMEFVKFILAKSSMLQKVCLTISFYVTVKNEVKMLRNLLRYPRASSKAEILVT